MTLAGWKLNLRVCIVALIAVCGLSILSPAAAADFEEVHACDTYAAHPDDPNRWYSGLANDAVAPGPAIKFCEEAVEAYPDVPRFLFQLGRGYWSARRYDEAVAVFLKLEESAEYTPVYAYLADAFYFGLGGLSEDRETALLLYQAAAEGGFAPAEAALAALADAGDGSTVEAPASDSATAATVIANAGAPSPSVAVEEKAVAPAEKQLDLAGFAQPAMVGALVSGDLAAMELAGIGKTNYAGLDNKMIYVMSLNSALGSTCVELFDPALDQMLRRQLTDLVTGGGVGGNFEQQYNQMADQGLKMLESMFTDMSQTGFAGIMQMESDMQALTDSAAKDGAVLLRSLGCSDPVILRVHHNIKAHVRGSAPSLSPLMTAKAEEAKAKAASDQAQADRKRLREAVTASCDRAYPGRAFCGCIINELDRVGVDDAVWTSLQEDFGALLSIATSQPQVVDLVRTCRKAG